IGLARFRNLGLLGDFEAAVLLPAVLFRGGRLQEGHLAVVLGVQVEPAAGAGEAAAAQFPLRRRPDFLARLQVLADPAAAARVGNPVQAVANQDHAAVLVVHHPAGGGLLVGGIDLGLERIPLFGDVDQGAARLPAAAQVDGVLNHDGRGTDVDVV